MRLTPAVVAHLRATPSLLMGDLGPEDIVPLNPDLGAGRPPKIGVVVEHPIPVDDAFMKEAVVQVAIYASNINDIDDYSDQVVAALNDAPFGGSAMISSTLLVGSATALIDPGPALARTLTFSARIQEM